MDFKKCIETLQKCKEKLKDILEEELDIENNETIQFVIKAIEECIVEIKHLQTIVNKYYY